MNEKRQRNLKQAEPLENLIAARRLPLVFVGPLIYGLALGVWLARSEPVNARLACDLVEA